MSSQQASTSNSCSLSSQSSSSQIVARVSPTTTTSVDCMIPTTASVSESDTIKWILGFGVNGLKPQVLVQYPDNTARIFKSKDTNTNQFICSCGVLIQVSGAGIIFSGKIHNCSSAPFRNTFFWFKKNTLLHGTREQINELEAKTKSFCHSAGYTKVEQRDWQFLVHTTDLNGNTNSAICVHDESDSDRGCDFVYRKTDDEAGIVRNYFCARCTDEKKGLLIVHQLKSGLHNVFQHENHQCSTAIQDLKQEYGVQVVRNADLDILKIVPENEWELGYADKNTKDGLLIVKEAGGKCREFKRIVNNRDGGVANKRSVFCCTTCGKNAYHLLFDEEDEPRVLASKCCEPKDYAAVVQRQNHFRSIAPVDDISSEDDDGHVVTLSEESSDSGEDDDDYDPSEASDADESTEEPQVSGAEDDEDEETSSIDETDSGEEEDNETVLPRCQWMLRRFEVSIHLWAKLAPSASVYRTYCPKRWNEFVCSCGRATIKCDSNQATINSLRKHSPTCKTRPFWKEYSYYQKQTLIHKDEGEIEQFEEETRHICRNTADPDGYKKFYRVVPREDWKLGYSSRGYKDYNLLVRCADDRAQCYRYRLVKKKATRNNDKENYTCSGCEKFNVVVISSNSGQKKVVAPDFDHSETCMPQLYEMARGQLITNEKALSKEPKNPSTRSSTRKRRSENSEMRRRSSDESRERKRMSLPGAPVESRSRRSATQFAQVTVSSSSETSYSHGQPSHSRRLQLQKKPSEFVVATKLWLRHSCSVLKIPFSDAAKERVWYKLTKIDLKSGQFPEHADYQIRSFDTGYSLISYLLTASTGHTATVKSQINEYLRTQYKTLGICGATDCSKLSLLEIDNFSNSIQMLPIHFHTLSRMLDSTVVIFNYSENEPVFFIADEAGVPTIVVGYNQGNYFIFCD